MPYRCPILGVMDQPIRVEQKDDPSIEDIDRVHNLLIERMEELFENHKHYYGWGHKKLIII